MWLFNLFRRAEPVLSIAELRRALASRLPHEILEAEGTSPPSLGIKIKGQLVAYIELHEEGREALVFYEYSLRPYFAAQIALALNAVIATSPGDSEFTAKPNVAAPTVAREGVH